MSAIFLAFCIVAAGNNPSNSTESPASAASADLRFDLAAEADPIALMTNQDAVAWEPATLIAEGDLQTDPFGTADTDYWLIDGGLGSDFKDDNMARFALGYGYFLADDFSLDFELAGLYFDQPSENAVGINLSMLFRYHFWCSAEKSWTLYGEAGAGLLGTSDDVPEIGSQFNFTPQIGFGATFDLGGQERLITGIRWHHVSNANTYEDNNAVDHFLLHAGVMFEF